MHYPCGIDFGTSNSALAIAKESIELLPVEREQGTIPSALFFNASDNKTLFGREAQQAYMQGQDGRFMRSLKRILGTSLIEQTTVVNGKAKAFKDIISIFVNNLKKQAEQSGYNSNSVIMGRPVHFVDDDKQADICAQNELENIARTAGFKNIEFQFEPIAAAFAHEQNLTEEKLSLVVDIGGGTSDFTIIRLSPERKKVSNREKDILANSGIRIGGNDFDKDLSINTLMPHMGYDTTYGDKSLITPRAPFHDLSEWSKVNFVYDPKIIKIFKDILPESHAQEKLRRFIEALEEQYGHHLLDSIENAKIGLTSNNSYKIDLSYIENNFNIDISINELNSSITDNVLKINKNISECLISSALPANKIELIILTGGSTEIPYIQNTLKELFPHAEISQENKLSSVAWA